MKLSPINFNYNNRADGQKKSPQKASSLVSFQKVTPEHFFIKMQYYDKNTHWGNFVVSLVNRVKNNILKQKSDLKTDILSLGEHYHKYMDENYDYDVYGTLTTASKPCLTAMVFKDAKFGEYFDRCQRVLKLNSDKLTMRNTRENKFYMSMQIQDKVDDKQVVLTQIGYRTNGVGYVDKDTPFLIHPPSNTKDVLFPHAQKVLKDLKKYNKKKLSSKDVSDAYEKIGEIHWCLAHSMPFIRGSAAVSDVYTKGLFEALKIQTTPWRKGISPDWEAFLTPMDKYAKKYKTFFEKAK